MKKRTNENPTDWIPKNWTFESNAVASRFNAHVREQLPWYDHLLRCVEHFGAHYIPRGGLVYDVGASTGNVGRLLAPYLKDRAARLVSIEPSPQMEVQMRVSGGTPGDWKVADATSFEFDDCDFVVCNLVLMFLPVGSRAAFLRNLIAKLRPGGAIVIVDKVLPPAGYLGTVLHRLTMRGKLDAGVAPEEILAKEMSLGGVQRPLSTHVVPSTAVRFFQFGEFVGWILEREETGLEPNHNFR